MSSTRRDFMRSGGMTAAFLAMASACARPDQTAGADLAAWDAVETAAKIKSGEISADEAVEAAIARSKRIEPQINAIVNTTYDQAKKDVPDASGLWAGVPTFIKIWTTLSACRPVSVRARFPATRVKPTRRS